MVSGETPSGITEQFPLTLFKYHRTVNLPPDLETFGPTEYDAAIMRAYVCSADTTDKTYHSFDVVDAWGVLVVRISARWIFAGRS